MQVGVDDADALVHGFQRGLQDGGLPGQRLLDVLALGNVEAHADHAGAAVFQLMRSPVKK